MMKMPKSDAASMPPNTGVPTARRLRRRRPLAITSGTRPEDEGEARHHHRAEAQPRALDRGLDDRLALLALLDRELDDQDRVLGGERDQHDEADLGVDVEVEPATTAPRDGAEHADVTESSTGIGMFQLS